jgi:hypothetical protein
MYFSAGLLHMQHLSFWQGSESIKEVPNTLTYLRIFTSHLSLSQTGIFTTSQKFKELVKEVNVSEENFIKNFIELHHVKLNEVNESVKKVLKALKKMKSIRSELEMINLLKNLNIPFTLHANIDCVRRVENFDIAIPNEDSPFCLIEITETKKFNGNFRTKALVTDHKFQMIKVFPLHNNSIFY